MGWQDSNRLVVEVTLISGVTSSVLQKGPGISIKKMSITNGWTKATESQGVHILGVHVEECRFIWDWFKESRIIGSFVGQGYIHTINMHVFWGKSQTMGFLEAIKYIPFESYAYTFRPSWRDLVDYLYGKVAWRRYDSGRGKFLIVKWSWQSQSWQGNIQVEIWIPSRELTYPTFWKGKSFFNSALGGCICYFPGWYAPKGFPNMDLRF